MEHTGRSWRRIMKTGWMLVAVGLVSARVEAQAGRAPVQTERVLVVAPVPADPGDSAYAVTFGDELRKGIEGKSRRQLSVVTKDKIGEALEASGFSRDALLDDNAANQLARFLQADAYVVGRIERNPVPRAHVHLIELRRSGLSGWVHVIGAAGATAKQLADMATDSMENHVRAAEAPRECLERRDRRDFRGAKERARRAFTFVPHHPAGAMCLAVVFEAEQAPPDSLIPVLELAVKGDSLNTRPWEMLGRQYQAKGTHEDSLKAAGAFLRQLQADPSDAKLRTGIAALLITLKEYARSREVLDAGLEQNPGDLATLQLKARACEEGSLWPCLVDALAAQYDVDTSLVGKLEFYGKIFGAAQQANDTAAMLKWSGEAVRRLPTEVNMWRARLAAFNTKGMTDSALVANRRIAELDRTDIRPLLGMAQIYTERIKIDSTVPLDTATLARVDSLLQRVAAMKSNAAGQPTDTNVWMNVAVMYFKPGTEMIQARVRPDLAIALVEKSKTYDVRKQLSTQADFFLGLGYMFNLSSAFDFNALSQSKSCRTLSSLDQYVKKLRAAMTAGASVQPATAQQVLANIEGIEKFVVDAGKAWKCS
ncbi:MAG: tetratricopeptide repeat protein [Gemmatimonadetes bacterium]|nr:tetratricopeptide repeat protein [Gemmatimonadota bacterium]